MPHHCRLRHRHAPHCKLRYSLLQRVGTLLWCSVVGFRPGLGADVKLVCIIHAPDISFKEHCMTAINLYMLKKFENGLTNPIKLARQAQAIMS